MRPTLVALAATAIISVFSISSPAHAAIDANTILRRSAVATSSLRTLCATFTITSRAKEGDISVSGPVYLSRPNLARIDVNWEMGNSFSTVASDGREVWQLTQNPTPTPLEIAAGLIPSMYRIEPADATGRNIFFPEGTAVTYFFHTDVSPFAPPLTDVKLDVANRPAFIGIQTVNHEDCYVVERKIVQPAHVDERIYIGPDYLIRRIEYRMPMPAQPNVTYYMRQDVSHLVANQPIPESLFAYSLPIGAQPYIDTSRAYLLKVGDLAPDFALHELNGKVRTLYSDLHRHKAVLIDFWFVDCTVCRHEFPHLENLYASLKPQGLDVIAVDIGDSARSVANALVTLDMLKTARFPISTTDTEGMTDVAGIYGVDGYPTSYLIDNSGKIVYVSSGFDDSTGLGPMDASLIHLGFILQHPDSQQRSFHHPDQEPKIVDARKSS